jgi:hypothetical protein
MPVQTLRDVTPAVFDVRNVYRVAGLDSRMSLQ